MNRNIVTLDTTDNGDVRITVEGDKEFLSDVFTPQFVEAVMLKLLVGALESAQPELPLQ